MLTDYTLDLPVQPDAYAQKQVVWKALRDIGVPLDERAFLYSRCPIDGSLILRSDDPRVASISSQSQPVLQPEVDGDYDFWLRASPCVHRQHACVPADPQTWLSSRIDGIGVEILTSRHRIGWTWCGKLTDKKNGFSMFDVVFVGRLAVRDADKLAHALPTGIGRHRAFGFGLMQLFN